MSSKSKTTHLTGNHNVNHKKTIPKPKHWSFITPSEGRKGKPKRAKPVKLKRILWKAGELQMILMDVGAGTPECKWDISTNSPFRKLTSRDVCYVLQGLQNLSNMNPVLVEVSDSHRILIIDDCSMWIKNGGEDAPLAQAMMDQ